MYSFKNVKYYFSIIICSLSSSSELMAQTITWSQVNPTAVPLSGTAMLILALTLFIVATYLKKYPHVVRSFVFIMTMFSGVFLIGSGMLNNIAVAFSSIISINSPSGTKHLSRNGVTQVVNNYSSPIRITGLDPEDCSVIRNECNTGLVLEKNDSCEVSLSCGNELIEADFEKQVYIKKEQAGEDSGTALTFLDTGVLRNYDNDGEGSNTWSIASGKLKIGNDISLALKSKTDNKYTFTITEPSGTFETDFFRAKPLSTFDLNGKILAFDVSDDPDCSVRTLKVMGNSANISEICTGGNSNLSMNLSTVSDLDNTLELSFIENETPRTVMMVLVEGSIAQSGTVAFIHKTNNIFTGVELETITATDEEAYNPFQVEDKKLVMKSDTSSTGMNNQVSYGFISTTQDPTFIVSLDAELSLMESSISGDARARTAFYQELRSLSTNDVASIFVAIDHRASGIASRAFLKINGVETTISEIHKKPLEKGKSYHFKLDTKPGEDNISLSLAGYTATILKSSFPVSDLYVSKAKFQARVKNSEASNFARGSVDNIVLNRNKDGIYKIITRNFDDGITPVADDEFNSINF